MDFMSAWGQLLGRSVRAILPTFPYPEREHHANLLLDRQSVAYLCTSEGLDGSLRRKDVDRAEPFSKVFRENAVRVARRCDQVGRGQTFHSGRSLCGYSTDGMGRLSASDSRHSRPRRAEQAAGGDRGRGRRARSCPGRHRGGRTPALPILNEGVLGTSVQR